MGTDSAEPLFQLLIPVHNHARSSGSDILNADNSASELGNSVAVETAQLYKDLAAIPGSFWK